jgi:hypothetical protein
MSIRKCNSRTNTLSLILLIFSALVLSIPLSVKPVFGTAWWNNDWAYRKQVTIDHTKVVQDLTGFPILISVADADLASKAQDDGDDIAFADSNGTKLDHEIEFFNGTSGNLVAWVSVPNLSSTVDTVLYMYYGNPSASSQENVAGVWSSDYRMVQHLSETSGTHYDSSQYGNNGTYYGSQQNATGQMDGADGFVGNFGSTPRGDYVDIGNDTSLNINEAITISAWIKSNDQTQWNHICTKGNGEWNVDANRVYQLAIQPDETIDLIVNSNQTAKALTTKSVSIEQWFYVVGTYDGGHLRVYIDGVENASSPYTEPIQNNTVNLRIASRVKGTGDTGLSVFTFNGLIDEVRVSSVAKSASWILTEYNNQHDPSSFYTIGNEQTSTIILIDPETTNAYLGQQVSVDIDLSFASHLYGFEFWLSFNNSVLNATSIEYKGYLNEPTREWYRLIDNSGGYLTLAMSSQNPATGKTGGSPPPLATVRFQAIGIGVSQLHLYKTILSDDRAISINHETIDGIVHVATPPDLSVEEVVVDDRGCAIYANDTYSDASPYYYPVNVRVKNTGTTDCANFHVKLEVYWINGSLIENTQELLVMNLTAGTSTTINFTSLFHPTHTGYYRLTATVDSRDEVFETDETNNLSQIDNIRVTIIGDINSDQTVNILDATVIGLSWNATPLDPQWNIKADINHDGEVNSLDAIRLSAHWRESW